MLFDSSLRKELSRSFGATLVVLITVVMSMILIRTLGLASQGSVNPRDVLMVMGYAVLGHLSTILTLSLFISVNSTMGRLYRDSEMAIWFSSGRGVASFTKPILRFAWPILLAIVMLALFVWPWSNQQTQLLRNQYETRGDLDRIAPGQFQENSSGTRVFFIEREDTQTQDEAPAATPSQPDGTSTSATESGPQKTGKNIFISSNELGKEAITSARDGRMDQIGENQFLILNNGQRLEQTQGQEGLKVSEFKEYGARVGRAKIITQDNTPPKALRSVVLLRQPTPAYLAELGWRIGLALAALNLVLFAIVISASNPRSGRGYSMAFALLAFVVYYNLLNAGYGWVSTGKINFTYWMLGLHGGIFAATCLWLAARNAQWSVRHLLPAHN